MSISYLWNLGLWSCPGAGLLYPPHAPIHLPRFNTRSLSDTDVLRWLQDLPTDLCLMIKSFCPDSPLWRYSVAAAEPPKIFTELNESQQTMLPLRKLPNWTRGTVMQIFNGTSPERGTYVRLSLDGYGIQQVEFLSSWPDGIGSSVNGTWYIVEAVHRLSKLQFQSRVRYPNSAVVLFADNLGWMSTDPAYPKLPNVGLSSSPAPRSPSFWTWAGSTYPNPQYPAAQRHYWHYNHMCGWLYVCRSRASR